MDLVSSSTIHSTACGSKFNVSLACCNILKYKSLIHILAEASFCHCLKFVLLKVGTGRRLRSCQSKFSFSYSLDKYLSQKYYCRFVFYKTNEMQLIQCSLLLSALYVFRVFHKLLMMGGKTARNTYSADNNKEHCISCISLVI
jgi:hypothetical protein